MNRVLLIASVGLLVTACGDASTPKPPVFAFVVEQPVVGPTSCVLRYRVGPGIPSNGDPVNIMVIPQPQKGDPPARQSLLQRRMEICKAMKPGDRFELSPMTDSVSSVM